MLSADDMDEIAPPPQTAVLLYGPTFNSLGGGEVWLNRIANAMAGEGRHVRVIGKAVPATFVQHPWDEGILADYLEPRPESGTGHSGMGGRVRSLLNVRFLSVSRTAIDRLIRGWRPRSTFTSDISEAARERLVAVVSEFARLNSGRRVVVICTDVYTGSHMAQLKRSNRLDVPYYVMHHNSFASLSEGTKRAYRRAASTAEAFLALTEEDSEAFRRAGFPRVATVHNPGPEATENVPSTDRDKTVAWLARMTMVKRGDVAIRAWARVADEFDDWRLRLYGDGPERIRLERLARRLDVQRSVEFRGVTDDPMHVWSESAIHLLTSTFEGWPLVIAEAGSMAVPTVATNSSPGVREQISDGQDGFLAPIGDDLAIADALRTLMREPVKRAQMGMAARQHAMTFDMPRVLAEWRQILEPHSSA